MGGQGGANGARGGLFGFSQSTARLIKENTGVTFKYALNITLNEIYNI